MREYEPAASWVADNGQVPVPPDSVIEHKVVEPFMMATVPVGRGSGGRDRDREALRALGPVGQRGREGELRRRGVVTVKVKLHAPASP